MNIMIAAAEEKAKEGEGETKKEEPAKEGKGETKKAEKKTKELTPEEKKAAADKATADKAAAADKATADKAAADKKATAEAAKIKVFSDLVESLPDVHFLAPKKWSQKVKSELFI